MSWTRRWLRRGLINGVWVEVWSVDDVEADLVRACDTLHRIQVYGLYPAQPKSCWPEFVQEYWTLFASLVEKDADDKWAESLRDLKALPPRPTAREISLMDEVLEWFHLIDEPKLRRVVWRVARLKALDKRRPFAIETRRTGVPKETIRYRYKKGLAAIRDELNRQPVDT